jgi:hypothetical protein
MSKLTIAEVAQKLGVSKEAIHNRIRRGSLQSVVENGIKLVILDTKNLSVKTMTKKRVEVDDRYYKLLEEQNSKLQQKVETLESETRTLRDQKEQMLVDEREKIEQIYRDKDEQLKNIINAISSKLMLNTPQNIIQEQEETLETQIELESEDNKQDNKLISLNKYIKSKDFSKKRVKKIKDKFKKSAKKDSRIITIGKKLYIDLQKYDYSDYSL